MHLYPHQEQAAQVLGTAIHRYGSAVDMSPTGTGKTFTAGGIAARIGAPVGVVCPKVVVPVWKRVLEGFGVQPLFVMNYELLRTGRQPWGSWIRRKFAWDLPPDTLLIWDEVHRAGGLKSQTAKMLKEAKPFRNLLLSATLAENPAQLRAVGHILDLCTWQTHTQWCLDIGCSQDPWGKLYVPKGKRELILNVIAANLFPERAWRTRIEDLGDLFPECMITAEAYDLGAKKEIEAALKEAAATCELIARLRARQIAEGFKVPALVSMAQDLIEEGNSVVIFTNFREPLERLRKELKCDGIYGDQKPDDRQAAIDRFQADESRCIIVNIQAGGVGLSLHDINGVYPRVALICPGESGRDLVQVLGRIHRAGGKSKAIQKIVFAADTIEEEVCKRVQAKLDAIETLNDGDFSLNASPEPMSDVQGCINPHQPVIAEECPTYPNPSTQNGVVTPGNTPGLTDSPSAYLSAEEKTSTSRPPDQAGTTAGPRRASPSALWNTLTCPGWENEQSGDRRFAERGERGHAACEHENPWEVADDPALKEGVEKCLAYVRRLKGKVLKEGKLFIKALGKSGRYDRLHLDGPIAHLIDFKFAHNEYLADSGQFWCYCLGIWDEYPQIETIQAHVLMPWLDTVDVETFTRKKHYTEFSLRVAALIARTQVATAADYKVTALCTYCGKAGRCPKLATYANEIAQRYDHKPELVLPESSMHGSEITDPNALSVLMKLKPIVEKATDGWSRAGLAMWNNGQAIPGFKQVEIAGKRALKNVARAAEEFTKRGGKVEDLLASCSIGVGEFEELIKSVVPRGQKAKVVEDVEATLFAEGALVTGATTYQLRQEKRRDEDPLSQNTVATT